MEKIQPLECKDRNLTGKLELFLLCAPPPRPTVWVSGWFFHKKGEVISQLKIGIHGKPMIRPFVRHLEERVTPERNLTSFCARLMAPSPQDRSRPMSLQFSLDLKNGKTLRGSFKGVPAKDLDLESPLERPAYLLSRHAKSCSSEISRLALENFLASGEKLVFRRWAKPRLSIVIVLYNRAELTLSCLRSLMASPIPFELILVDNASTDETSGLLSRIQGARIFRNQENYHFIHGANQGALKARGKYLLFLNSDCTVLPSSLERALDVIKENKKAGVVGARIIHPDATLQHAGGLVWNDASTEEYGVGDAADSFPYLFQRDSPYCCGAFLLTPTSLFREMGGFSTELKKAYYEDVDYCLSVRKTGRAVIYDPDVLVTHFENASKTVDQDSPEFCRAVHQNQLRTLKRHANYFNKRPPILGSTQLMVRRGTPLNELLVVCREIPLNAKTNKEARNVVKLVDTALKRGWGVTLYPLSSRNVLRQEAYRCLSRRVEIVTEFAGCQSPPRPSLQELISARVGYYQNCAAMDPQSVKELRQARQTLSAGHRRNLKWLRDLS